MGFDYFCFLSGLDWMPSHLAQPQGVGVRRARHRRRRGADAADDGDEAAAEDEAAADAEAEPSRPAAAGSVRPACAGGDTRFQVFARLYSTTRHDGRHPQGRPRRRRPRGSRPGPTIYPGADWNERETWEMYGFVFDGHPNLVKLYLPGEFEGFPLRKDFPLLAREVKPWPGPGRRRAHARGA